MWKETYVIEERAKFVLLAKEKTRNMAELCREFEISRKTGYKWLERYKKEGIDGLKDESRRPKKIPHATSAAMVCDIIQIRKAHLNWGPKKIRVILRRGKKKRKVPCVNTIGNILDRCGFIKKQKRRNRTKCVPQDRPCVTPKKPNEVWTVDFKGWWHTKDGVRCNPLTIRDEFSRYILNISALKRMTVRWVQEQFEDVFETYGLPDNIRVDNGTPFIANGVVGFTKLSAWWVRLGIQVDRTRPAHPQDNGGHERMHRDLKKDIQKEPANNLEEESARLEKWRIEFNTIRPHESLDMKTPHEIYRPSKRKYREVLRDINYPDSYDTRKLRSDGYIRWRGKSYFVSEALAGERIGVEKISDVTIRLWYCKEAIGELDNDGSALLRPTASTAQSQKSKKV